MALGLAMGWTVTAVRAADQVDPTGTWKWSFTRQNGQTSDSSITIKRDGDKLSGKYIGGRGNEADAEELTLKGDELSFRITGEREGTAYKVNYKGKLSGDKIEGGVEFSFGDQTFDREWTATRGSSTGGLAGTWELEVIQDGNVVSEPTIKLTQGDDGLKGHYASPVTGEGPVEKVEINGKAFTIRIKREFNGEDVALVYSGQLDGDTIKGKLDLAGQGTLDFTGKRVKTKSTIAGTWKLSVTTDQGETYEPTLKLKADGGGFGGVYVGRTGESAIENAKVDGEKFSFVVKRDLDGQALSLNYSGTLKGDAIDGTVDYDFDGQTGTLDFKGQREAD
jgi:hypothetical protein